MAGQAFNFMNCYIKLAQEYQNLFRAGRNYPLGGFEKLKMPALASDAPKMLLFSPHPDDECATGALPLRFRRDKKWNVINVAVTLGSNKQRQQERWKELQQACEFLNFDLIRTSETGLENVKLTTRNQNQEEWQKKVECIADIIVEQQPKIIVMPHCADFNGTHIAVHYLVVDALKTLKSFSCKIIETEFWAAMDSPNLMLEPSIEEVGQLITALSFHAGEVKRNPYHLTLPAWLIDNVRRGSEIVGGQGGAAPDFTFATLYRVSIFDGKEIKVAYEGGKIISQSDCLTPA